MEGKLRRGMIRMAVYATIGILPSPPLPSPPGNIQSLSRKVEVSMKTLAAFC